MFRTPLMVLALMVVSTWAQDCRRFDLLFLLDTSDDVTERGLELMGNFVMTFVDNLDFRGEDRIRVAVTTFNDGLSFQIPLLDPFRYYDVIQGRVQNLIYRGGPRHLGPVLRGLEDGAMLQLGGRNDAPNIAILITNGPSTISEEPELEQVINYDVTLITVGVGSNIDEATLRSIACKDRFFQFPTFTQLISSFQPIRESVCEALRPGEGCHVEPEAPPTPTLAPIYVECSARDLPPTPSGDLPGVQVIGLCGGDDSFPTCVCEFQRTITGLQFFDLPGVPQYDYRPSSTNPRFPYTETTCTLDVSYDYLGEGTHTFRVFMYPNVTGGRDLVNGAEAFGRITILAPRASHSCPPILTDDYLCGKEIRCNCSLGEVGHPVGEASWFENGVHLNTTELTLAYSGTTSDTVTEYTCEGVSALGRTFGSMLQIATETECEVPPL